MNCELRCMEPFADPNYIPNPNTSYQHPSIDHRESLMGGMGLACLLMQIIESQHG